MKIDLNADMRHVYARLAEKQNAGEVRQDERHIRNVEEGSSSLPTGSTLKDER
jgi:5-methylcytosine-specific restriction endonuclease McrA